MAWPTRIYDSEQYSRVGDVVVYMYKEPSVLIFSGH